MKTICQILTIFFIAALAGCSGYNAQNPVGNLSPVNATATETAKSLMLGGYDVVAYFTQNKAVQGDAKFASDYEGVRFHFSSAEHKALFDKKPDEYQPQYGGYCSNGIVYGIPWGGQGEAWVLREGKLYIFSGKASKDAFLLDAKMNVRLADEYWTKEIHGNSSHWQRLKRMIARVSHYKSSKELAALVQAAQGAGQK